MAGPLFGLRFTLDSPPMLRFLLLCFTLLAAGPAFALRPVAAWWAKPDTLGLKYQQVE